MPSAFDGHLPNDWDEREAERRAANLGLTVQEHKDLQVWLRHGRIGTGRSYQEEVARSYKVEAERAGTKQVDRCGLCGADFNTNCHECGGLKYVRGGY